MSSDIFAGNQNNVARSISKIWAGSENNIAMPVKGVFIGDSNNTAIKVWPNSILPSNYQQLEYLKFLDNTTMFNTGFVALIENFVINNGNNYVVPCRVVMACSFPNGSDTHIGTLFDSTKKVDSYRTNHFSFGLLKDTNTIFYGYHAGGNDEEANITMTSNSIESILPNTRYLIDYCNLRYSQLQRRPIGTFYLYNSEGYYSIPEHQVLLDTYIFDFYYNTGYPKSIDMNALYLFGKWDNNNNITSYTPFPMIFYYSKIYNGAYLVRDLYPCYRKYDNAIGLYDMVNLLFLPSGHVVGDGSIALGPTV